MKQLHPSQIDIWALIGIAGVYTFGAFNIFGIRQDLFFNYITFLVAGIIAFLIFYRYITLSLLKENHKLIYIIFVILLIITLINPAIRGSHRWINLYIFKFQTSEFFKPFFLIVTVTLLSGVNRFKPRNLAILIGTFILSTFLIFEQPDLGSVIVYTATLISLAFFAGSSSKIMAYLALIWVVSLPIAWQFIKPYQRARIVGFINPNIDPQGLTYNLHQSIITVGSGGVFGKGLGLETQANHNFLPEFHTDFAFASLIEQFGFIGGMLLLLFYGILLYRLILRIFQNRRNTFNYLFLIGTVMFVSLGLVVNIGMNLGLMPVTGIALPFISYGGSSIVSTMILLGLALSI